jgi:chemotaxis signal transduction protein
MSDTRTGLAHQGGELRLAFDRSFAEPVRRDTMPMEDLLAFHLGSEPYAVRSSEIAGLFADRKVTRLPGGAAALLGIAGFRGAIVPVYDLHALLGCAASESPRWLVIASSAPVALAFEAFDGHLRIPRDAIVLREASDRARKYVREFVSAPGTVRSIVHLPTILDVIANRIQETGAKAE